jgi:hypothetical protein
VSITVISPTPGADAGTWGAKLNTALLVIVDNLNTLINTVNAGLSVAATLVGGVVPLVQLPTVTLYDRFNHTGTQSADTVTDGILNKSMLATERTKLTGIAAGATANSSDATLEDRANHTGTQAISTVTSLQSTLDGKVVNVSGFGRVWGRTLAAGQPTSGDGAVDGDYLFQDAT